MILIEKFSNKEVPFRYNGVNLSFFLSQRLFSSYSIDAGTKLLLKTIAKEINFTNIKTTADIGCGVGVIGLSLKAKYPDLKLLLQDRDALAIEFSKGNAAENKLKDIEYSGELALEGVKTNSLDLIVSNLPAKAGEPVLKDFIKESLFKISEKGICAVVVVSTLKNTILNAIRQNNANIIFTEENREYAVFQYCKKDTIKNTPEEHRKYNLKQSYIRSTSEFCISKLKYTLKTVYNLPGFDTIPYSIETAAHILEKQPVSGRTLFWNPGQGHLPVIVHLMNRKKITETILASNDMLQLKISKENLSETFSYINKENLKPEHICCPEALSTGALYQAPATKEIQSPFNSIIISLDNSDDTVLSSFMDITAPNGILIITGKSSYIAGAVKNHKGWIQLSSRKYRGFRSVIFKRD